MEDCFLKGICRILSLCLALCLALGLCAGALAEEAAPVPAEETLRETTSGPVIGKVSDNGSYAWLGIPYAVAERWEAPVDPEPWTEARVCTVPGPFGIQFAMDYTTFTSTVSGVEDCLNLDVYAPADAENLPV